MTETVYNFPFVLYFGHCFVFRASDLEFYLLISVSEILRYHRF